MPPCVNQPGEDRALCICAGPLSLSLALAWPYKDNVKVKVRRNKALCGVGGTGKDNLIPGKTSLSGKRRSGLYSGWLTLLQTR